MKFLINIISSSSFLFVFVVLLFIVTELDNLVCSIDVSIFEDCLDVCIELAVMGIPHFGTALIALDVRHPSFSLFLCTVFLLKNGFAHSLFFLFLHCLFYYYGCLCFVLCVLLIPVENAVNYFQN